MSSNCLFARCLFARCVSSLNNSAAHAGHCPDDENDEEAGLHSKDAVARRMRETCAGADERLVSSNPVTADVHEMYKGIHSQTFVGQPYCFVVWAY